MPARSETPSAAKRRAVRQSVTLPMPLAVHVRRVAKERHLTISCALVALAERGVLCGSCAYPKTVLAKRMKPFGKPVD